MSARPTPGTVCYWEEPIGTGVVRIGTTRRYCRAETVTVLAHNRWEPTIVNIRRANGEVRSTHPQWLTPVGES